jgi:hypothetical protein
MFIQIFKLAKIFIVFVFGSVEDKWCFSIMCFMKWSKFKNRLKIHVDLVVMMFTHNHYSIDIFPFANVIKN